LGQARQGETVDGRSRPWSAGAGSGALATGLVQMAWVLELAGEADLFVWEAFVSGTGKPVPAGITQHAADAAAAADTFADRWMATLTTGEPKPTVSACARQWPTSSEIVPIPAGRGRGR